MNPPQPKLLIVEDDDAIRTQLKYALREEYALSFAPNRAKALALVKEVHPDIVSLDLGLPPHPDTAEEGLQALEEILRAAPTTKVIVVTGNGDRSNARRAVELGASDYLSKPIDLAEYGIVLRRNSYLQALENENARHTAEAEAAVRFDEIIGSTPRMREIFATVSLVAKTGVTVLVEGESGTGKELVARAIHHKSRRKNAPFVAINCGAIPETLLESELFGHEKGAYTGAHVQRKGKLEQADSGTVFLDEIAEIAATNKELKSEIAAGRFREDLYFRLSVVTITLPPLHERGEDIGMLANAFLRQNCQQYRRRLQFSPDALTAIARYPWPGNIRELQNAIQRAAILARGRFIEASDLGIAPVVAPPRTSLREARNRVERQAVVDALIRTRGNISRAATELGISRPALHDLLEKHNIDSKELRSPGSSAGAGAEVKAESDHIS
jgi:two-component system NtrC family response regulator